MGSGEERVRYPSLTSIRDDIPLLQSVTYLNSASCSPLMGPVIDAMTHYYTTTPVNYRSGQTPIERLVADRVDAVRRLVATHIGAASPREVVFTKNATEGINVVASGMDWEPGDEVVTTPVEHQSNLIPWMRLSREAGVRVKFVRPDRSGRVDPDDLRREITPRTRLVTVHHVSNLLGTIQDIAALSAVVRGTGALLFVDAAQSDGRMPVRVPEMGCDFLTSCARKGLMGPQGIGFLWAKGDLLRSLRPLAIGGLAAEVTDESAYRQLDPPSRHEAGILNTAGAIGLGAAVEHAEAVSLEETRAYVGKLTSHLTASLDAINEVEVFSPADPAVQGGIVSWALQGWSPIAVAEALYERCRIVVAAGNCGSPLAVRLLGVEGVVRSSLHHFNNTEDVDQLTDAVQSLVRKGP